jgi:hypothetical protein
MPAIDNTQISNILNALTPTGGTAGFPTAFTAMAAGIMKIRLNSTLSAASAAGTELSTQTSGYTNGTGWALGTTSSTASSAGSAVGVPFITQSFVSNGSPTAVVSFDLESSASVRGFWGPFNGQPVNVASGNTFQVVGGSGAAAGLQISLT